MNISALTDQRYALEVLELLGDAAMSVRELSATLHSPKRPTAMAMRALAVDGLVRRDGSGSWDDHGVGVVPFDLTYRRTERGQHVVRWLSSFAVWESLQG